MINYPNSPTGKAATRDFYARVVEFALRNRIVVVQDAAHAMLSYDARPLSFLETPGAREVGVELHSLSKGWNMIGWRMGWICGNARIVRAVADVKDNCDSGQFIAIQKAAAAALDDPEIPRRTREKYRRRLQKLVAALRAAASTATCPAAPISSTPAAPRDHQRPAVSHGRPFQPVPHRRALDLHRPLGRRRPASAIFRHLRSGPRSGRGRPDGRRRTGG